VVVEMAHLMFLTITTAHAVLLSVCLFKTLPQPMEQSIKALVAAGITEAQMDHR
jgi:hypothetical protein